MAEKLVSLWVFLFLLYPVKSALDTRPLLYQFSNGFSSAGNNMSLNGDAVIENNGLLRLTNNSLQAVGHAFYSYPIPFKNSSGNALSFSTSFAFAINTDYGKQGGHGLAFTISPTKDLAGAQPGPYLGLFNSTNNGNFSNHIFAVELDTVQSPEFGDIDNNHVGIDINSLVSNASIRVVQFNRSTTQDLTMNSGQKIQAWVAYNSENNQLDVKIAADDAQPRSVLLSRTVDLSPIFLDSMYIGFSASTGSFASSHYILGWSFNMNGSAAQNLYLSLLPSPPTVIVPGSKKNNTGLIVGVSVSGAFAMILVFALSFYVIRKCKNGDAVEDWELDIGPHRFPYQELDKATRGFKDTELIGIGGFGKVYKGTLPNSNTQVAVKRISHDSKQGMQEFVSEISSIGRLRHRNLVQLLGWCHRRGDLLLVYEFMPNGSLDKCLFGQPENILSWEQRFKIIKGVASGLLYLHEEWEQTVVHRDIKAGNVLVDSEFNGKLGDFGLAKLHEHGSNPGTTRVAGTPGYIAPELIRTAKPNTNSDVFAFGAMLLEVACGRRPFDPKASPEDLMLVDLAWEKWCAGAILDVVDPRLEGNFDDVEVVVVLKLGLMCSNNAPEARPTMRQVVRYLEREVALPEAVAAPDAYHKRRANGGEFDEYLLSFHNTSSNFENATTWSSVRNDGDANVEPGFSSHLPLVSKGDGR